MDDEAGVEAVGVTAALAADNGAAAGATPGPVAEGSGRSGGGGGRSAASTAPHVLPAISGGFMLTAGSLDADAAFVLVGLSARATGTGDGITVGLSAAGAFAATGFGVAVLAGGFGVSAAVLLCAGTGGSACITPSTPTGEARADGPRSGWTTAPCDAWPPVAGRSDRSGGGIIVGRSGRRSSPEYVVVLDESVPDGAALLEAGSMPSPGLGIGVLASTPGGIRSLCGACVVGADAGGGRLANGEAGWGVCGAIAGEAAVTSVVHCEAGAGAAAVAGGGTITGADATAGAGAEAIVGGGGKDGPLGPTFDGSAEIGGGGDDEAVAEVLPGRRSCFGPVVAGMMMRAGGA